MEKSKKELKKDIEKPVKEKTFTAEEVKELIEKKAIEMASKIIENSKTIEKAIEMQPKNESITPIIDVYDGVQKVTITNDKKNREIWKVRGFLPK